MQAGVEQRPITSILKVFPSFNLAANVSRPGFYRPEGTKKFWGNPTLPNLGEGPPKPKLQPPFLAKPEVLEKIGSRDNLSWPCQSFWVWSNLGWGVRGGPHKIPKFWDQNLGPSGFHVSYGCGKQIKKFFYTDQLGIAARSSPKIQIFLRGSCHPPEPKMWRPFLAYFAFWKNSSAVPGCNSRKRVSANHRGGAYVLGLSKLGRWGLRPIFGNFSKMWQNDWT